MNQKFKNYKTVIEKRKLKGVQKAAEVFLACPGGGMSFSAKRKVLGTIK